MNGPAGSALKAILWEGYGLRPEAIRKVPGGLSALAYEVIGEGKRYFLKVYPHSRCGVSRWIAAIPHYAPVLGAMVEHPALRGRVPVLLPVRTGGFSYSDSTATCLLYEFIEGRTPGDGPLSEGCLRELADILTAVHRFPVADDQALQESFAVPFAGELELYLKDVPSRLVPENERDMILPLLQQAKKLGQVLASRALPRVCCHNDLHRGNLMQTPGGLVLIDWEGLSIGPPEADLFFLGRYREIFYPLYRERCGYSPDPDALAFFSIRRRLEDIFEFLRTLLLDKLPPNEYALQLDYLRAELRHLTPPMEFDFI